MMNAEAFKEKPLHLLDDEPSDKDSFGAHNRIANAIQKIVNSNQGGKTIALFGEWGSGKSTTIKQLKLLLNSNTHVFTYDAWVHSGDHLRKSFLNELIDFLIESKCLEDIEHWKEQKDILAGKLKKIDKTTEPEFTRHGRVLIPLFLALPVTTVLFNNLIQGYIKDQFFFTPYHWIVLAFTILSFAAIIWPFIYITRQLCSGDGDKVLSLIMNKSVLRETTTSTEQPEATSIEFQEVFRKAMKEALLTCNNYKDKKLIIVIDNLDRVDTEEAKNIWSFLKGFIDNSSYKKQKEDHWVNKLWVIVPLAIQGIIDNGISSKEQKQSKADEHFLEKIFQVRFFLPPPVHAEWKKHLVELLVKTFPLESASQLRLVQRLYENFMFEVTPLTNTTRNPNPREVKLFINDLVAMVVQWENYFSLAVYASYLLANRSAKSDFVVKLRAGSVATQSIKRILNEDPSKKYAALFFNIDDVEKANAVLLKPLVEDILRRDSGTKLLQELRSNKNLIDMLDVVIHSSLPTWATEQSENFFRSLCIIADAMFNEMHEHDRVFNDELKVVLLELTINSLRNDFPAFPLLIKNSVDAVIKVSNVVDGNKLAETTIFALKKLENLKNDAFLSIYPVNGMPADELAWINDLKRLFTQSTISLLLNEQDSNSILLPISLNNWLGLCRSEEKTENGFLRVIHPSLDEQIRKQEIESLISNASYDRRLPYLIKREILYSEGHGLADTVLDAMYKYASNGIPVDVTLFIVEDLISFRQSHEKFDNTLDRLNLNGALSHLFHEAEAASSKSLAAITMLAVLIKNPELKPHTDNLPDSITGIEAIENRLDDVLDNEELFDDLIRLVENYEEHRVFIDVAIKCNYAKELIKYVESKVENKSNIYKKFSNSNFIEELKIYIQHLDLTDMNVRLNFYDEVFKQFKGDQKILEYLDNLELSIEDIPFYSRLLQREHFRTSGFVKNITGLLETYNRTEWLDNIRLFTWSVKIINDLTEGKLQLNFGMSLKGALYDLLRESLSDDDSKITIKEDELRSVKNSLSKEYQNSFVLDLYDFVAQPDKKLTDKFWELFKSDLQEGLLTLAKKGMFLRRLMKPLILNKDSKGLAWLTNLLESRNVIDLDDDSKSKSDVIKVIKNMLSEDSLEPEFSEHLTKLLSQLNRRKRVKAALS